MPLRLLLYGASGMLCCRGEQIIARDKVLSLWQVWNLARAPNENEPGTCSITLGERLLFIRKSLFLNDRSAGLHLCLPRVIE
jgi:hypothetical protein